MACIVFSPYPVVSHLRSEYGSAFLYAVRWTRHIWKVQWHARLGVYAFNLIRVKAYSYVNAVLPWVAKNGLIALLGVILGDLEFFTCTLFQCLGLVWSDAQSKEALNWSRSKNLSAESIFIIQETILYDATLHGSKALKNAMLAFSWARHGLLVMPVLYWNEMSLQQCQNLFPGAWNQFHSRNELASRSIYASLCTSSYSKGFDQA